MPIDPHVQQSNAAHESVKLEVAQLSYIALLQTGRMISHYSNGFLAFSGATALMLMAVAKESNSPFLSPTSVKISLCLLVISSVLGIMQHHAATRVAIDLEIFLSLRGKHGVFRILTDVPDAPATEGAGNMIPEQLLAEAMQSLKQSIPAPLLGGPAKNTMPHDPLSSYKRSAKLYYRQSVFAAAQILTYVLFVLFMVFR